MFHVPQHDPQRGFHPAIAGLMVLSLASLAVTVWVMVEFLHEQEIVANLLQRVPPDVLAETEELAGELRWQFRLLSLIILNLVATAIAVVLLSRAWRSSEASLRDFKALAADILSSMDQAVITTDLGGVVTSINRRGYELLGLQQDSVDRALSDLPLGGELEVFLQDAAQHEPSEFTRDFPLNTPAATRTLRAFAQPLCNHEEDQIGKVLQLRDVTERVLMEDRMRRMERYIGLGSLAAGLHHEIKNPLAALSLHVQLLEERFDGEAVSNEILAMLEVIRNEVNRVIGVLESFRDYASVGELSRSAFALGELIDRQLRLISPQAARQHIAIREEHPSAPLPPIEADRGKLEQVLLNLLVNAMEAMPDGGTLTVRLRREESAEHPSVCIDVADTGPGIPENLRSRILDPYFTTKRHGTGMGLALCEKILQQHDGSLEFHSGPTGTVFTIRLPLRDAASRH